MKIISPVLEIVIVTIIIRLNISFSLYTISFISLRFNLPLCILNIGGISNVTIINESTGSKNFFSKDIGPGNCLIDQWVRKHSSKKYDLNGNLASSGEINEII